MNDKKKANQKLFRDDSGEVKNMLNKIEGISYKDSPIDFFILLARYKFAARLIRKDQDIIDVGCGKGYGTVFLSKYAKNVVGVDRDDELISYNSNEHSDNDQISFKTMDLLEIDKSDIARYDAVVSMDVIEHFVKEDIPLAVENYSKLIKDDGFAIIGTPNIASRDFASQRRIDTHPFEFTDKEFEETLKKSFKNVFMFSMTDEIVSTQFTGLSWYLMALCTK
jgi:2-polyprenyl-3-methyl-5-hydroxy-6-metoxy-1,4-benzoquinol methylase